MLTIIMECRDQEPELAQTLAVLVAGAIEGLISDVIILDHGSRDGSATVADAAGCRFYQQWDMADLLKTVRGEWLLLIEPGARPCQGWIDDVAEHMAVASQPAQFSPSRLYRRPFLQRLMAARTPLECGLLIRRSDAQARSHQLIALPQLTKGAKLRRLSAEIIPSWVASAGRAG